MVRKCRGTAKRALLLTMFLAAASLGCSEDGAGPDGNINGRYELRTVNGSQLPYTVIALGNNRAELLSGFLQVNTDGTFSATLTTRVTQNGQVTTTSDTDTGSWTQTGNQVRFTSSDGTVNTGVVTGNQISAVIENISLVFSK